MSLHKIQLFIQQAYSDLDKATELLREEALKQQKIFTESQSTEIRLPHENNFKPRHKIEQNG